MNSSVGLENLLAKRVCGGLVETLKKPRPRWIWLTSGPQNGLQTLDLSPELAVLRVGRYRALEAQTVERKLVAILQPISRVRAV
jgi:hypothetical protein